MEWDGVTPESNLDFVKTAIALVRAKKIPEAYKMYRSHVLALIGEHWPGCKYSAYLAAVGRGNEISLGGTH
jgi:hypothetical protein